MASRRKGRILAFQALFSWDAHNCPQKKVSKDFLDFSWASESDTLSEEIKAFSRLLITGTLENISAVDDMIQQHLHNWELSRLNRVDLAILRMSIYSLMFDSDIHPSIVIDEAIGISKEFGTDESYRFINGVLDGVRKTIASQSPGL